MIDYNNLLTKAIKYRRDLHKIPELGFDVFKTEKYIKNVLSHLNCKIEPLVKTGLTAFFDFNKADTIAFRADMDGLPIKEVNTLSFVSQHEGCMHACGHDGHVANLLAFAKLLSEHKKIGTNFNHNILLIFQPAEETIVGAKAICGTEIFEKFNVKEIYGLHLWPMLGMGTIASRPGPMMAHSTQVNIDFFGKSAHCGEPEKGNDALDAACRFVNALYKYREEHIPERCIIKFGKMSSGNVRNAISSYTRLEGTMRTFLPETWDKLVNKMNSLATAVYDVLGVNVEVDISNSHPAVINDEILFKKVKKALLESDLDFVELKKPVAIAEDFSFFQEEIPGVFFFLGTGSGIPLHSNNYNFDENVLLDGIKLFESLSLK